jgi:putative flippase GtrA
MEHLFMLGRRIYTSRLFRVLFIGGIGFCIQTVIFELLSVYLHLVSPSTAVLLGAEVSILCNFYFNNKFSFADRAHTHASILKRLVIFHAVVSGSLAIQWVFVFSTEHTTSNLLYIHAAYLSGVVVGFLSNYAGYHCIVWRKHTAQ